MTVTRKDFVNRAELVTALCASIAARLTDAITKRGQAAIAVSGGTTPGPLFCALSIVDLPWSQVQICLVDERWVDEDHPDSNAGFVRRTLLQNRASAAQLLTMKTADADAFTAQGKVNQLLANKLLPLDVVLLGMGTDGHTASLFPHAEGLAGALDLQDPAICQAIRVKTMPYTRMTLTLSTLLSARYRILQIHGTEKQEVLKNAMQQGSVFDMPVRALLNAGFADTEIFYSP